jgi:DNA gyrase/topoisomerase IV subunit B
VNEPYLCHQNCNDHSPTLFLVVSLRFVDFWPSLLDIPGFLQQFITPIVKVTKESQFFTLPEYEHWLESTGNNGEGYTAETYSAEAKEYFSDCFKMIDDDSDSESDDSYYGSVEDEENRECSEASTQRTLIVCEGDSAKSLVTKAMAELSEVGLAFYGVFSLKGKPIYDHDEKTSAVNENEEIENLAKIMGLQYGTVYDETNVKTLRYRHLMIAADQNSDGSRIKGLIVHFLNCK